MLSRLANSSLQAAPLLRAALAAAATQLVPSVMMGWQQQQARGCMSHHRIRSADAAASLEPHIVAAYRAAAVHAPRGPLPVVASDCNVAAGGEPPASAYAAPRGGLAQHGEAANLLFSDDHSSPSNELEKLLQVAAEQGGPDAVFQVFGEFEGDASELNVATAFHCLAAAAARLPDAEVERQILRHPGFSRLVAAASAHAGGMSDAELSEVGAACAALHTGETALARRVHFLELNNLGALGADAESAAGATAECLAGAS